MAQQRDGPALSLRCFGMSTGQCAVVVVFSRSLRMFLPVSLVDSCLRADQTQGAPDGEQCETANKGAMLLVGDTTDGAI